MKRLLMMLPLALVLTHCSSDDDETTTAAATTENFTLNGAASGATSLQSSTPSVAKLGVYGFAVSENTDCSNPTTVIDNGDTPSEFDMIDNPTLGTGDIPDGTYPCVIMIMSSTLTVAASETSGPCTADVEFSQTVCGGQGGEGVTTDLDGNSATCGGTQKAYLYLSTASLLTDEYQNQENSCESATDCNSFAPPTADNLYAGVPLGSALVVSGDEVGVFTLSNLSVGPDGGDDECGMGRPDFTFTSAE